MKIRTGTPGRHKPKRSAIRAGGTAAKAAATANYRIYSSAHLELNEFHPGAAGIDMTLDEIPRFCTGDAPQEYKLRGSESAFDEHIEHVARRITGWRALESELQRLRDNCNDLDPRR